MFSSDFGLLWEAKAKSMSQLDLLQLDVFADTDIIQLKVDWVERCRVSSLFDVVKASILLLIVSGKGHHHEFWYDHCMLMSSLKKGSSLVYGRKKRMRWAKCVHTTEEKGAKSQDKRTLEHMRKEDVVFLLNLSICQKSHIKVWNNQGKSVVKGGTYF